MMNYSSAAVLSAAAAAAASAAGYSRTEVACLPKGWIREEMPRFPPYLNGTGSSGGSDVVYYSPKGARVSTKQEMSRQLGDQYDLTAFDFQTGKINPLLLRASSNRQSYGGGGGGRNAANSNSGYSNGFSSSSSRNANANAWGFDLGSMAGLGLGALAGMAAAQTASSPSSSGGGRQRSSASAAKPAAPAPPPPAPAPAPVRADTSLVPPIRQTASIFKQPVTVHKNEQASNDDSSSAKTARPDLKTTSSEKPRQLFWEKRLSGLRASYPDEDYEPFTLPSKFKAVGPEVESDVVLASISTSLHMVNGAINGQADAKAMQDKDPSVFVNPEQPLISATKVNQDDIDRQEARVSSTRKRLAEALSALSG